MNLQCGTWSQVLKVHATFNLVLNNIAIYLVTQVAMGAKKARTRHGSGSLHKTLFEISHIRSNLLMRGAIMCRVRSRMTFSNLRSNCGSGGTYLSSCPALQPVCRITQGAGSLPCALLVTASQNVRPHIRLRFDFLFVVTIEIASYSQDPGSLTGEEKALKDCGKPRPLPLSAAKIAAMETG